MTRELDFYKLVMAPSNLSAVFPVVQLKKRGQPLLGFPKLKLIRQPNHHMSNTLFSKVTSLDNLRGLLKTKTMPKFSTVLVSILVVVGLSRDQPPRLTPC